MNLDHVIIASNIALVVLYSIVICDIIRRTIKFAIFLISERLV
jgi:hypothetical protein